MSSNSQLLEEKGVKIEVYDEAAGQCGRWTDQENLKYIVFLNQHRSKFICKLKRKKIRLFQQMASFLDTRSAIQCRTHHQKYQHKFGEVKDIIRSFKQELGLQNLKNFPFLLEQIKARPKMGSNQEYSHRKTLEDFEKRDQKRSKDVGIQTQPIPSLSWTFPSVSAPTFTPNSAFSAFWIPFYY